MTQLDRALQHETVVAGVTYEVVNVDAAIASGWLDSNTNNRPLRLATVARYRADMINGLWRFAADPIRFSEDGDIQDGQHRLHALSEVDDLVIPMLVVRGLSDEARDVMDQGVKRTASDQLAMRGHRNSGFVAASAKQHLIWERGLLFRDSKLQNAISNPQIEQWVRDHPAQEEFLASIVGDIRATDARPSAAGAAGIAFFGLDPEPAGEFFHLLARGAGGEGHPITTLDKRLSRLRREHTVMPVRDHLAMMVQAWNAWRDGRNMIKFQRPRGASWSEDNFPVPH